MRIPNWLRNKIRKWLDKMQYRIEHDFDKPIPKEELKKLIMTKEEVDKLIKNK